MTNWTEIDNKLLDPRWCPSPDYHETFRRLRDEDPVHWTQDTSYGKEYWAVTRYDDVKELLHSPADFSSRWDTRVPRSPVRLTPEERHERGMDIGVATTDDPIHNLYRRPINKHFSTPAIARLAESIERIVDEIVNDVRDRDQVEFIEEVAAELPVKVILRMLGVPEEDWPFLREAAWQWLAPADPRWLMDGDEVKTSYTGQKKIIDYCDELARDRRENPRDDFATVIGNLQIDGTPLSLFEMRSWFTTMILGGLETTRNAAGVGTWLFLQNPDQRRLLANQPELAPSAVEEVLRWGTPPKSRLRIATRDMEWKGQRIRSGDWVVGFLSSANMDERQFTEPHRFDITRTPNEHLSLGSGIHVCLGRALARLELVLLFPRILEEFPDMQLVDTGEPTWIQDRNVTGLSRMMVALR